MKEYRYDPLPDEVRAVIIASWKRGGLLPAAAIEQMVSSSGTGDSRMSDDLTDDKIALLCAIGKCDSSKLPAIRNVVKI